MTPPVLPPWERPEPRSDRSSQAMPALMRADRPRLLAVLVGVGLGRAAVALGTAYLIGQAFGGQLGLAVPLGDVLRLAGALVLLAAAGAGLTALERVLAEKMGQSYVQAVRMKLFGQVSRTPLREAARRSTGSASVRFTGDLSAIRMWVSMGLARLAVAVPLVTVCMIALVVVSPAIALGVGVVLLLGAGVTVLQARALRTATRAARRRRAQLSAHVTEHVAHTAVMQAFGQESRERAAVRRRGKKLRDAMVRRAGAIGAVRATAEATLALATGGVVVLAVAGGQGAGPAAAAVAIVGYLVAPVRDLSRVSEYRTASTVATEKITQVLARRRRPEPAADASALPDGPGRLELRGVTLSGLFGPISVTAEPGSVVALVGPNGSGKSTLLTAIAGLGEIDHGSVRLDGTPLSRASTASVRSAIGFVGADVPLLRGTVAENVRYADRSVSDDDVARVMAECELDGVLAGMDDGADTKVGERGAMLSSGQRQRVALARALLTRPRLLLLDEADANLDPSAAQVIDRVVAGYPGTVVLVTHRPERAAQADAQWHLAGGRLTVRIPDPVH